MMSAPFARAASTNAFTFGTLSAQRLRRSGVQVCTVKSMTRSAVSFGTSVTGLSAGGAGSLALFQSSMMVAKAAAQAANVTTVMAAAMARIEIKLRGSLSTSLLGTSLLGTSLLGTSLLGTSLLGMNPFGINPSRLARELTKMPPRILLGASRRDLPARRRGDDGGAQRPLFHDDKRGDADREETRRHGKDETESTDQLLGRSAHRSRDGH